MAIRSRVYVLTGNFREYLNLGMPNTIYVMCHETLMGVRGGALIKMGTWYLRPDIDEVLRQTAISGLVNVRYEDYVRGIVPPGFYERVWPDAESLFPPPTETVEEVQTENTLNNESEKYFFRIGYENR